MTNQHTHTNPPPTLHGECWVMLAYNAADMIDLNRAKAALAAAGTPRGLKPSRRVPDSASTQTAALRITERDAPAQIAGVPSDGAAHLTLYDFGVVSVAYRVPLDMDAQRATAFAVEATRPDAPLRTDAASRIARLLATLGNAAIAPASDTVHVEDYLVFRLDAFEPHQDPDHFLEQHADHLTRVLRASPRQLSAEEITDALSARTSHTPADAVVVDWNAAAIFDTKDDAEDALIVLEYANAQLLELRLLDEQLDKLLDGAWRIVQSRRRRRASPFGSAGQAELARIGELQVDASLAFEAAGNAIKLLGDQYLARIYALAARRFRIPDWDRSIARKIDVAQSIYQKLHDRATTTRMEILEWIIIVLIAISIAVYFI